jgi:type II secretion system protein H
VGPLRAQAHRARRGYTLIELLVVAAIVSVVLAVTALAWRTDPARALEAQAQRLAGQLELALARARLSGARLAFSASPRGYAFWQRDAGGPWREIEADSGLAAGALAAHVEIAGVESGGLPVAAGERVHLSADEMLPLAIVLDGPGARALVTSGVYAGRMEVRMVRAP